MKYHYYFSFSYYNSEDKMFINSHALISSDENKFPLKKALDWLLKHRCYNSASILNTIEISKNEYLDIRPHYVVDQIELVEAED